MAPQLQSRVKLHVAAHSETGPPRHPSREPAWVLVCLSFICALYVILSCIGITWGLPSRKNDPHLFGGGKAWSGEKIYQLAHAAEKLSAARIESTGADVDIEAPGPAMHEGTEPVLLTGTQEDVARIYLRYRLYTYQPDEMITMMALAGMKPGELRLDPRLYQYGGLFIYPVGALIKFCGILSMIDVRSDLVYYLDNPDEFGKFYVVARSYSAAWGLAGVLVVFALTRRIATSLQGQESTEKIRRTSTASAGLAAALFFTLMPVVVCMSHEGKPHLPGAVLMLLAVYLAVRAIPSHRQTTIGIRKCFWLLCIACGAAVGMVLSSWPICVLIPLAALLKDRISSESYEVPSHAGTESWTHQAPWSIALGGLTAVGVYAACNPYVVINLFSNRDVLSSNFGNSLAMYEVSRLGEGLLRVLELTIEGATIGVVILGSIALMAGLSTRVRHAGAFWLLVIPAALFFLQFVLIGAGKPAEYGRFGIFTNTALVVGSALFLNSRRMRNVFGTLVFCGMLLSVGGSGLEYLQGFQADAGNVTSRIDAATEIEGMKTADTSVLVPVEPAPYSCPPLNFAAIRLFMAREQALAKATEPYLQVYINDRVQEAGISWANKRIEVRSAPPKSWRPPLEVDND